MLEPLNWKWLEATANSRSRWSDLGNARDQRRCAAIGLAHGKPIQGERVGHVGGVGGYAVGQHDAALEVGALKVDGRRLGRDPADPLSFDSPTSVLAALEQDATPPRIAFSAELGIVPVAREVRAVAESVATRATAPATTGINAATAHSSPCGRNDNNALGWPPSATGRSTRLITPQAVPKLVWQPPSGCTANARSARSVARQGNAETAG